MNHELAELYGRPSILTVAKAGRIRRLGHVTRMPDLCPTKKVFDSYPQFGIRRRGAQRTRWPEIGCLLGWEAAARDRVSWRMFIDRVFVTSTCSFVSRPTKERER